MIRIDRGWRDPEEPNCRWTAVPPAEPFQECDAVWVRIIAFALEFLVQELDSVSQIIEFVGFDPVDELRSCWVLIGGGTQLRVLAAFLLLR